MDFQTPVGAAYDLEVKQQREAHTNTLAFSQRALQSYPARKLWPQGSPMGRSFGSHVNANLPLALELQTQIAPRLQL